MERSKPLWLLVLMALVFLLLGLCAPKNASTESLREASLLQPKVTSASSFALKSLTKTNQTTPLRFVPCTFPREATNFHNWDIQTSVDEKHWATIKSNVFLFNDGTTIVWPTNNPQFWRWQGRP